MKIFKMLTTLAAFFAVALFSGCDDDKGSEPDPQPVKLASPGIVFKDVKPTSFAASWTAVEHAAAFGYKLLATDGDSETVVAEVASYDAVEVSFSGLKPATAYTLEVVELAGDDPGYTDSDPAKASTTTADEPVVVTRRGSMSNSPMRQSAERGRCVSPTKPMSSVRIFIRVPRR